jgi:hypothetical protein
MLPFLPFFNINLFYKMDYLEIKSTELIGKGKGQIQSWNWNGQAYPNSVGILIQATKPDGYKSSQSSSVRFLKTEIQNAEKASKDEKTQEI